MKEILILLSLGSWFYDCSGYDEFTADLVHHLIALHEKVEVESVIEKLDMNGNGHVETKNNLSRSDRYYKENGAEIRHFQNKIRHALSDQNNNINDRVYLFMSIFMTKYATHSEDENYSIGEVHDLYKEISKNLNKISLDDNSIEIMFRNLFGNEFWAELNTNQKRNTIAQFLIEALHYLGDQE